MKAFYIRGLLLGLIVATFSTKLLAQPLSESPIKKQVIQGAVNAEMYEAVTDLLATLDASQKKAVMFSFEGDERYGWHFVPRQRSGLSWEVMSETQRAKLIELLKTALSNQGYDKAREIMQLELVLREVEGRGSNDRYRHPEKYYLTIYGEPDTNNPWGWRFEGHHLSLNFSAIANGVAVTPAFMGSNPAKVPMGKHKGKRVLKAEEDMARTLLGMLDESQNQQAIIAPDAPDDILTMVDRQVNMDTYQGIQVADLTDAQRVAFLQLLRLYLSNMEEAIADTYFARIEAAGIDKLYFAWAGSTEIGKRHYYRIHGPTILIEYDNTQNNANHIHTVWRDPSNDFGEDLLQKHYQTADHHKK